ncbi:EAL domain-containing protein [Caldalkalibacillus mannanilyticus]|uniref:EAL domain-containing protein n=1 Tax=Caldalkalibacillus mannanilyticus TaxID=1418 RepID=UPI000468D0EA|nr:EAL domain-containing protein [Caldalkalibacillus mannanilyticus]
MRTINVEYSDQFDLYTFIRDQEIHKKDQILIQVFTSYVDEEYIHSLRSHLLDVLPQATIIGTTTDGEILNGQILTQSTVLSFTIFEKTSLSATCIEYASSSCYQTGVELARRVVTKRTKALLVFADGLNTNGNQLLNGIESVAESLVVAGGLAGDGGFFVNTFVFTNHKLTNNGVVAVALDSDDLLINTAFSIDWHNIGKVFTVTNAVDNRVYTIDHKPVLDIYKRYLGEAILERMPLPSFPLIVERDGLPIARSVLAIHSDGSISYTGDLLDGEKVQFAFGNTEKLLSSTRKLAHSISKQPVESMFIYSCMARRRYLFNGEDVQTSPLQSVAPTVGFYSYGEFYHNKGRNELLSQSLTILILSESEEVPHKEFTLEEEMENHQPMIDNLQVLSNLVKVSTEDFQLLNESLEESEQRYKSLFEHNPDIVYSLDLNGKLVSMNKAYSKILGYQLDDIETIFKRMDRKEKRRIIKYWRKIIQGHSEAFEVKATHQNGSKMYFHLTKIPIIVNQKVVGVYGIAKDITQQKKVENQIAQLAYYDSLTDLPNRVLFNEILKTSLQKAKQKQRMLALLFIDLDRFKTINDTLGHFVGDQLLKRIAKRLRNVISTKGTVARFSGDEFIILLDSIEDVREVEDMVRSLLQAMKEPNLVNGQELIISTSIGVSMYPENGHDADSLMKNADSAMHKAKKQGRNRYQFFTTELNEKKALESLLLENHLRKALEKNEFILHYQPFISLHTNQIEGCEALIRWKHPELGLISPATFIPLAEEMGLIDEIGNWVIRTACHQNRVWQLLGYSPITMSVNVSGQQFQRSDFVDQVKEILEETFLDPEYLHLEITESIALEDVLHTMSVLNELSELGVGVAMDDFGTGYSSLSYLKDFPIDILKIDRSFIRNISLFERETAIVKAIISMSKSLMIRVLAEGVETEEQLYNLRECGCDIIQGFLFSKPLPQKEFEVLLQNKYSLD